MLSRKVFDHLENGKNNQFTNTFLYVNVNVFYISLGDYFKKYIFLLSFVYEYRLKYVNII